MFFVLSGCSSLSPAEREAPLAVARSFVAAMEARDPSRMLGLIEPTDWRKEMGPELRSYIGYVEQIEFRDPTYTLQDNDGTLAHVRVAATMRYTITGAPPGEQAVDMLFELVKVDATWYLRTIELPRPNA